MGFIKCSSQMLVGIAGVIFFLFATVMLALSVSIMVSYGHLGDDIYKHQYTLFPVVVMFVVAIFFFLAAIVACFGMYSQNRCLLTLLGGVLVMIIATLALGVVGLERSAPIVDKAVQNATLDAMQKYGQENQTDVTQDVDYIQETLQCCGSDSYKDWKQTPYYADKSGYPPSCCNYLDKMCNGTQTISDVNLVWKTGCYQLIKTKLKDNKIYVTIGIGVVFGILALMLLSTLALCFVKRRHGQDLPYSTLAQ